jgi:hypothetical protein
MKRLLYAVLTILLTFSLAACQQEAAAAPAAVSEEAFTAALESLPYMERESTEETQKQAEELGITSCRMFVSAVTSGTADYYVCKDAAAAKELFQKTVDSAGKNGTKVKEETTDTHSFGRYDLGNGSQICLIQSENVVIFLVDQADPLDTVLKELELQ